MIDIFKEKIKSLVDLDLVSKKLKQEGKKIILCHGTFDILHIGHIRYLKSAKKHGDILFVTITSDAFVLKGPGRPIFNNNLRSEMLANLDIVDFVGVVVASSYVVPVVYLIDDSELNQT